MLRHLFILARDASALADRLTITLDRHLARGEQIELVEDRRSPPSEPSAPRWPAGRERRRASAHADQLHTQGYAIVSREDEAAVPAPRAFEPILVAPRERARAPRDERRALRDRLSDDVDEELEVRDDFDDRDDFLRPRRRGGLVAVLVVVAALAAGIFYFSTQPRDLRLAGSLNLGRPTADTAARAGRAAEEGARAGSDATDRLAPAPTPATPTPATPAPPIPSDATPSAATSVPTTPAPEAPRPSGAPREKAAPVVTAPRDLPASPSLPPRRAEAPAPERSPDPAPQPVRAQTLPVFPGLPRVEVMRAASPEGMTFTVLLADPRGRPLPDAEVWLRQQSTDGFVRETKLEPVSPAGSYRAAMPVDARRPGPLTLRVLLGDRRIEMPVAD